MQVSYQIKWNNSVKNFLQRVPEEILYITAKQTLDLSVPIIPQDTGKMKKTSMGRGVRKTTGGYYIGSFTNYASSVWKMDDMTTKWTTEGTHSQWYARTLKEKGTVITNNAINQAWKEAK